MQFKKENFEVDCTRWLSSKYTYRIIRLRNLFHAQDSQLYYQQLTFIFPFTIIKCSISFCFLFYFNINNMRLVFFIFINWILKFIKWDYLFPTSVSSPVWSQVWWCLLELEQVLYDAVSLSHDDLLGDCWRCVVFATHVPSPGRECGGVCQPCEESHFQTGGSCGSHVVSFVFRWWGYLFTIRMQKGCSWYLNL